MKIALAAQGFINKDLDYNKDKIIRIMTGYSKKADLILFGESFMHGFECLTWKYAKDINFALLQDSDLINEIREASKEYKIGVSFGYIEKFEDKLFSSQMTIGDDGEIINNYRRVSIGWKEDPAGSQYCEAEDFIPFTYKRKTFVVGILEVFLRSIIAKEIWYKNIKICS